jgi:hypothetical protein
MPERAMKTLGGYPSRSVIRFAAWSYLASRAIPLLLVLTALVFALFLTLGGFVFALLRSTRL